jgi:hypothetical protein
MSRLQLARKAWLHNLLQAYERGANFARPHPWRRDVRIKLNDRAFPAAYAPEGRETLEALRDAAAELERLGAVRVVRHRGHADGEIKELRMGAQELSEVLKLAQEANWVALDTKLIEWRQHLRRLSARQLPEWMAVNIRQLIDADPNRTFQLLDVSRDRFKRETQDILDAWTAACALAIGESGWLRMVSEKVFGNSKRLAEVRGYVEQILQSADPRWEGVDTDEIDLLEAYGIRRKPGYVHCSGMACIQLPPGGRDYCLEDFAPAAQIPEAWINTCAKGLVDGGLKTVTTIENEYPFFAYIEEAGGPNGLGNRHETVIFTGGFPSAAVSQMLSALASLDSSIKFRHWGDADVGGLRIWWTLRGRVGRSVALFRTSAAWLSEQISSSRRSRVLSNAELGALKKLKSQLESLPVDVKAGDILDAIALITALLDTGVKLEQERY